MKKPIFVFCLLCVLLYFSCTQKTPPVDKPVANVAETNDPGRPRMTFENFKVAYNKNSDEILHETISEWSITDGEKADTAKFNGEGYNFLVTLSNDNTHHVTGVIFGFQLTQQDATFMMNNFRMYALILTVEQNTTIDEAAQFLTQLTKETELTTRSGAKYKIQNVQGNIILTISL